MSQRILVINPGSTSTKIGVFEDGVESFTESGGLRAHVARCLEIYRELRRSPARVVAAD